MIQAGEELLRLGFLHMNLPFDLELIRSRTRDPEVVKMRRTCCYILMAAQYGPSEIGRVIHRSHCTVIHFISTNGYADAPRNTQELLQIQKKQTERQIEFLEKRIVQLRATL